MNLDHTKAIKEIPDISKSKKEVRRLTGWIGAFGRFISRLSKKEIQILLGVVVTKGFRVETGILERIKEFEKIYPAHFYFQNPKKENNCWCTLLFWSFP